MLSRTWFLVLSMFIDSGWFEILVVENLGFKWVQSLICWHRILLYNFGSIQLLLTIDHYRFFFFQFVSQQKSRYCVASIHTYVIEKLPKLLYLLIWKKKLFHQITKYTTRNSSLFQKSTWPPKNSLKWLVILSRESWIHYETTSFI